MTDTKTGSKPVDMETVREWIQDQIKTYDKKPADTEFQRGYERCLYDILTLSNGVLSDKYDPRRPH